LACAALLLFAANTSAQPPARGGAAASTSGGQPNLPPLPTTGIDLSAIDHFWRLVDTLDKGAVPSESQWQALLGSPGYRLASTNAAGLRRALQIALTPALRGTFDSLTARLTDQSIMLQHIARAKTQRAALNRLRDTLNLTRAIQRATVEAAKFLPAGVTSGREPPFVAVAIFTTDGYAGPAGVIVDLLVILENGLDGLLAHEFHHMYMAGLDRLRRPANTSDDFQLISAISSLRSEGIADMIDKPQPMPAASGLLGMMAERYNMEYARAAEVIQRVDSLLSVARDQPGNMRAVGAAVRGSLTMNSHPHGAYMARTIQQTFGVDSLFPGLANPFAFIRTFAAAERSRGRPAPFSPKSVALLDSLEKVYVTK
jgi:hypothetical protein